jgi:multidrug resistance efflux pump
MTEARLAAEERRLALLTQAELKVPSRGMIWKLGASNGERVAIGDTVAEVIDCGSSFIVASIPQRDFSRVELGGLARFRLSGETVDREGRVMSVTGDVSVSGDRNLAAAPVAETAASGIVRIEVAPSGNSGAECLVGRTARVLLPVSGGGPVERLLRWLP